MLFVRDFLKDQKILESSKRPQTPVVSVILPTYSRKDLLERALQSVLDQTFKDFELIVMDDGSRDGSNELIETFRDRDPRIIHVRHERNSGLPGLRVDEGMVIGRGRFFAFQFDDDVWRKNALSDLVEAAQAAKDQVVVVGKALFHGQNSEWLLPSVDVNMVTLYETNRIANNSVLFSRDLIDRFGMYDCHIGMRRLCDWDLWLRYFKWVPLRILDSVISDVYEKTPGSIGLTVPWDLPLFRMMHDLPRNELLTPARWLDYEVDSIEINNLRIGHDFRRRLYEDHIAPYYFRFRHHFPQIEGFQAVLPAPGKTVTVVKNSYDVSNEVTLNHFHELTGQRGRYSAHFEPLQQVTPGWVYESDGLLLIRAVESNAKELVKAALDSAKPIGLHLDDDLLNFHQFGEEFDYLEPGQIFHDNLQALLSQVDAVWVTNEFIASSVRPYTPRVIPHNNAIAERWLPQQVHPHWKSGAVKIGYAGSGYRIEDFSQIWDALVQISLKYGDRLQFEFWGLDVSNLPKLASPMVQRPFTFSYFRYLEELRDANFDILLTPLLDYPQPRLGKSLIKYYETAVAGALGIFSDVPQYRSLHEGITCLKAKNTADEWYRVIEEALTMPVEKFDLLRARMLAHVREEYTESAQIHLHEAAWRATEFHAKTRLQRGADGKPRVMYVLHSANMGGGEIQLWRRLRLARSYGIEPIIVLPRVLEETEQVTRLKELLIQEQLQLEFVDYTCFTEPRSPDDFFSEFERDQIRELLQRCGPSLVHTVTFIPSFGQVCTELGVPHVTSVYAVEDDFAWSNGYPGFKHCDIVESDSFRYTQRWGMLLDVQKFCSRQLVPEALFCLGQQQFLAKIGEEPKALNGPIHMVVTGTFQERKSQLEIIQAFGKLIKEGWDIQLDFYGYTHFFPEYVEKCQKAIESARISDRIRLCGFTDDVVGIMKDADILLSLSTYESFPSSIKEAMASGVLVVATPVGGVAELVVDNISGILCNDVTAEAMVDGIRRALELAPVERQQIIEQARRVARSEFHPYRIANDLFEVYNRAIDNCSGLVNSGPSHKVGQTSRQTIVKGTRGHPVSVVKVNGGLWSTLAPDRENLCGLDVMVGLFEKKATGFIILKIYDQNGLELRKAINDLGRAQDNQFISFRFDAIPDLSLKPLTLQFHLIEKGFGTTVGLYENVSQVNRSDLLIRRIKSALRLPLISQGLYCRKHYGVP